MASVEVASIRSRQEVGRGFDPTWGAVFRWAPYRPSTTRNHCVFCWAPFAEPGDFESDAHAEGYVTAAPFNAAADDYLWVCDSCFYEHRDKFAWRVAH